MSPDSDVNSSSEEEAILAAALDYMEGWYTADPTRMERALHTDLAKRTYVQDSDGQAMVLHMSALKLVQNARNASKSAGRAEIQILDRFDDIASVRAVGSGWIDYMHLVRVGRDWKIINILWRLVPGGLIQDARANDP